MEAHSGKGQVSPRSKSFQSKGSRVMGVLDRPPALCRVLPSLLLKDIVESGVEEKENKKTTNGAPEGTGEDSALEVGGLLDMYGLRAGSLATAGPGIETAHLDCQTRHKE